MELYTTNRVKYLSFSVPKCHCSTTRQTMLGTEKHMLGVPVSVRFDALTDDGESVTSMTVPLTQIYHWTNIHSSKAEIAEDTRDGSTKMEDGRILLYGAAKYK